jgi:hypothetical protein
MTAMNHWQLPLDGPDQARSLHRMLIDRKLSRLDEFSGSPHIATIQHRLADMIAAAEPGKHWDHWRQAEHHPDRIHQIRRYLQQSTAWPAMPPSARRQLVQNLLAPLTPSDALLDELTSTEPS